MFRSKQTLKGGQEVLVGAVTDPSFGKMIAFALGRRNWSK